MEHPNSPIDRVPSKPNEWDHSTHDAFFRYYADQSGSDASARRFLRLRDIALRALGRPGSTLEVAEIGCGPGTHSLLWAELGHHVHGLDVSEHFIALARQRSAAAGYQIDFQVGSATLLPWSTASMDVCLAIGLLEHVAEWERCLDEFTRILRPGGILFLTTSNALCPRQQEFNLPLYSWYPSPLKRRYERLARTSRPELASYATYPAVNWFTFFGLRRELRRRGCRCRDRFDLIDPSQKSGTKRAVLGIIRMFPLARVVAHVGMSAAWIVAMKD